MNILEQEGLYKVRITWPGAVDWEGGGIRSCGDKTTAQVSWRQVVSTVLHQ